MPVPRIFLFAVIGLVAFAAVFWSLNVNFIAWLGAWFSESNPSRAGLALLCVSGVASAFLFTSIVSKLLPGPGAMRGILFGAFLATMTIWVLPYTASWLHMISGNARVVYSGDTRIIEEVKSEKTGHKKAEDEPAQPKEIIKIDPVPTIGKSKPVLASLTRDKPWAAVDSWRGRLLPFGAAFIIFGLVLGVFLSDEKKYS